MRSLGCLVSLLVFSSWSLCTANAADLAGLIPKLKQGGYVLIIRHVATDNSQKDAYPFVFNDMKKQRQLSEQGRHVAREMGAAFKTLGIPLGQIYSSKLNRAIETSTLISGAKPIALSELTDSGAGSASAMDRPSGSNAKIGKAILELVNKAPTPGTNNVFITHKTNIADAFGKTFGDAKEGEALIYMPNTSGAPVLIDRVQAGEWIGQAGRSKS